MKKIIIYSTPTCVYCRMAKEYFQKKGYEFEEYDVTADEQRQKEMISKSHQMGVPVIDIGGTIIVGFNRAEVDKALEK